MTKRILTSAAVAACLAAAAPAAASAAITAGGSFARTAPFIDGTIYVFECHAAAPGAVQITSCTMTDGLHTHSAPGASGTGFAFTDSAVSTSNGPWRVCWTATGGGSTTSGCSTTSEFAGAGASTG